MLSIARARNRGVDPDSWASGRSRCGLELLRPFVHWTGAHQPAAEADAMLAPLEATVRQRSHRSACARLGHVRGRLLGAQGDAGGAEEAFALARAQLAQVPLPYEKARVDFAHGLTLRRLGRRRDAAERLTTARAAFAALGAQVYVARCDRELKTGRPAPRGTAADVPSSAEPLLPVDVAELGISR